jgi:hypothetical protein
VARIQPELLVELITPVLTLVGASGMNADDREEWITAAAMALEHLPEDLVRIGLKAAMRKADHPSKVIPLAIAEVEELHRTRIRIVSNPRPAGADALPAPGKAWPTAAEVDEIMAEHGIASLGLLLAIPCSPQPNRRGLHRTWPDTRPSRGSGQGGPTKAPPA